MIKKAKKIKIKLKKEGNNMNKKYWLEQKEEKKR